jgi:PAS domain S-box-containing protein
VNFIETCGEETKNYLCVGHKILDDDRITKFNQLGEKNYQLIVEGLNAGVFFQDKKGELIAANQKAAEIFGTTLERLYQLTDIANLWNTAWEIKTEDGIPVPFEKTPFMKALQTGKSHTEVLHIRLRNGEYRWLHFSSQPLFDDNRKEVYAVVSNIADVTQERKLSGQLQERDALFNVFMKQTPSLAWIVDEDGTFLFGSHSFYRYFGLNEKTSTGKKIEDLVPAAAKSLSEKHYEVLANGKPVEFIEKVKWADGTNFVFHINIFPIAGVTSKKILGGYAVNLSDKYAAEKQLKEANDRLLMITRATSDAIWEWDMQTGNIFRNDALMDMIGYHAEDKKGLSWWLRRIHPEDRNRVSDKVKDITEKGLQSWEDEYRFKCADGEYKPMHDKGYVVYENGLPVKMIGSLQDISGLKDLENQLTEEKLQSQKEISEMMIRVQEKERTRIGHELHDNVNQVLSTTKLFIDMLSPATKEEKQAKQKSVEYLLMAIEEIRKLSKELVVPQLNLEGLVTSINGLIEDIHMTTAVKIKFTHDHENDMLSQSKKVTLFRIVQEQLKNILKHSKANHVDIYLQCKDREVQFTIRDNGIGFDSRQTHRGIGLANIFERTRFYNGTAEIHTAPGDGCTLEIRIPMF